MQNFSNRKRIYGGHLPMTVKQFNTAARQLIELDEPPEGVGNLGEGSSSSSGTQASGLQKSRAAAGENSKKRHSYTSLTMSHKPCLAVPPPQRHSMEISGLVLISTSNPLVVARIGRLSSSSSSSAPSQVHICMTGLIVTPPPSSPVTTATVFTFPPETSYSVIPVGVLRPPPLPPPQLSAAGDASSLAAGQGPLPTASDQSGHQRPIVKAVSSGQPKVPLASQAGRGINILSPSSAPLGPALGCEDPSKPLPSCKEPVPSGPLLGAVVTAAYTPTGQHPKVQMHATSQITVNQAQNAVRTAVCHNQDRPTAAVTPIQSQNSMAFLPHSAVCPQQSPASSPVSSKMGVAMGCAASSFTRPKVSVASLEVDTETHRHGGPSCRPW